MGTDHGSVGDAANQGKWGDETEADDDRISQGFKVVVVETGVDHE